MLLSVFGTPSALLYGGLNLVRRLTELGIGEHTLANANSIEDLKNVLSRQAVGSDIKVVFYSDLPDSDLSALFIKSQAPMVLFVDDFEDVVGYLHASRDMSIPESIRLASRSFSALEPIIRSDLVLKLDSKAYQRPLSNILNEIGEFFQARLSPASTDRIAASLTGEPSDQILLSDYLYRTFNQASPPGASLQRMPPGERRIVSELAKSYSAIAAGHTLDYMDWPISMFFDSADPTRPFSGCVELLGPARFLAYGPYLHLTPGQWYADVEFEIRENLSGNLLYVDVYAGDILNVFTAPLPAVGKYLVKLGFEIINANEPVQVRFQSLSGAIEGIVTFNRVEVRRAQN